MPAAQRHCPIGYFVFIWFAIYLATYAPIVWYLFSIDLTKLDLFFTVFFDIPQTLLAITSTIFIRKQYDEQSESRIISLDVMWKAADERDIYFNCLMLFVANAAIIVIDSIFIETGPTPKFAKPLCFMLWNIFTTAAFSLSVIVILGKVRMSSLCIDNFYEQVCKKRLHGFDIKRIIVEYLNLFNDTAKRCDGDAIYISLIIALALLIATIDMARVYLVGNSSTNLPSNACKVGYFAISAIAMISVMATCNSVSKRRTTELTSALLEICRSDQNTDMKDAILLINSFPELSLAFTLVGRYAVTLEALLALIASALAAVVPKIVLTAYE